jgi:hypothetical protein
VAPANLERNRRAAIENIIDNDPVAAVVREIMADRAQWRGSASDLLQIGVNRSGWPKSPRALAGRLRGAETFLRTLGIEIVIGRERRLGTRTIRTTAISGNRSRNGGVGGVVGIEGGVVSGVIHLESSRVGASDWRPRHEEHYQEV